MLKKLIIIENGKEFESDTLEEIVKVLIDENFYNMTKEEKAKAMKIKALANCIGTKIDIVDTVKFDDESDFDNKFIIKDEITYILSLLIMNKIILLERIDSNIFTKDIEKEEDKGNYIIVNKFAKEILKKKI